ncbi:hypothetical protein PGT21_032404 [Puccinia graminis f. sp. tritici]|uniref:Protein phosphatase n=2 Tax=Puccinia graminis f. sp. tritici TaxID=56615 RepID=E3K421_PUCGT|nr:uncharacterized protein PGTG_04779 [Puccinia graminis f. sp. tritici CRL 75-36-700-3]EFP78823.2 hypothetical protein PGTG_04779 [Puccinia graminis f. sp. tritici CRL 75-36-700-3]KAA1069735.1 hypothetical protein PGT21_032404 [Puccinia graminis f. sp. tritici]
MFQLLGCNLISKRSLTNITTLSLQPPKVDRQTRTSRCLGSIVVVLSPGSHRTLGTTRFQSTRSGRPICKFINAASFIGKPVSDRELSESAASRRKTPTRFGKWVETEKQNWSEEFLRWCPEDRPRKYERMTNSGHDWWFINHSTVDPARPTYLGVADGVGGWAEGGTDPAEVSQGIMFHADRILEDPSAQQTDEGPKSVLSKAFQATLKDEQVRGGASTALIARLDPNTAGLHWANLGDSSMIHIQAGAEKVGTQSKAQTHFFNCPYQLTKFPRGYPSQDFVADTPEMADSDTQTLQDGDLVLLFTDGIGDNLWTDEIRSLVRLVINSKPSWNDPELVQALAHTICDCAQRASFQENRSTPFEAYAVKHGITDLKGGKVDDITLVVSLVRYLT